MILYYAIKFRDIRFFCHTIQDVIIILQVFLFKKLKYTRKIVKQLYIFNITSLNKIL